MALAHRYQYINWLALAVWTETAAIVLLFQAMLQCSRLFVGVNAPQAADLKIETGLADNLQEPRPLPGAVQLQAVIQVAG